MPVELILQIANATIGILRNTSRSHLGHIDEIYLMETIASPLVEFSNNIPISATL